MPELWSPILYTDALGHKRAKGVIANDEHGRWPDGHYVYTSVVVLAGKGYVQTMNNRYELRGEWPANRGWSRRNPATGIVEQFRGPVEH